MRIKYYSTPTADGTYIQGPVDWSVYHEPVIDDGGEQESVIEKNVRNSLDIAC